MNEPLNPAPGSFVTVDPCRCRVWSFNVRVQQDVCETTCRAEIDSVRRDGQVVPVIGRPLHGVPNVDIEIICGMRRLFVARHLRIPLRVELRELSDREATVVIEAENSLRKQTSPYERGLWLSRLLRENLYQSQDEMGRELGISPTQVTRLLKFAEMPPMILGAFASPHDIRESWAVELHKAWGDERHRLIADRARTLEKQTPRPPAIAIYEILLASRGTVAGVRRRGAGHVVKSPTGRPLLRIERQRREVVLRIPNELVDVSVERAVTQAVIAVLSRRSPEDRPATAA